MKPVYNIVTDVIAEQVAATGTRIEGTAYLTKGPGSGQLVADASTRAVYYYTRNADGSARPSGIAFVSTKLNIQMNDNNATRWENVLVDIGFEAGDSRLKILGINETTGVASVGGITPAEQADNSNTFTAQANILDFRATPVTNSVEYQIANGTYYDRSGAIQTFTSATTATAETNSISGQIAALSSGQHVVVWICLNINTGQLDTVSGTPQAASGTLPNPGEFNLPTVFNDIAIATPLKGIVPVYIYYGQTISSDSFVYRAYDARGAFGSPPTPGGAITASGTATLVLGVATITMAAVTANSLIFLTPQETGVISGFLHVSARTPGTSFAIASSVLTDTAVIAWMILEP